jgi:hypothetical protein
MNALHSTAVQPGRRLRDRLIAQGGPVSPALAAQAPLTNHLLLVDDDLRETAAALGRLEGFLARTAAALGEPRVGRSAVEALADDPAVEAELANLDAGLAQLRGRLFQIARTLR